MHDLNMLSKRNDRFDPAFGFLDIAQRFQGDRLGLGGSARLGPRLGGLKEDGGFCLLGLEGMLRGSSLGLRLAPYRRI
jgi:hypothetical protein